ncbi:VOC family protein [Vacuolonema iberomarrocanum]|uniref:VOC family protein n=1 Tax=Vacuolonema iberomarrocanum TaxID=3454632 RepID=UPI0019EE7C75|nr:VOC family protein [filamentous cyanobacterium LEGE 07170]
MSLETAVGHIVWHDLLTRDVAIARRFYADLLGWEYQIEHAANFVWRPGEADYPLIFANGEAHGGFVELEQDLSRYWVAYVQVNDVDAVTVKAASLGATIIREPFDTPGVGRSSVIQDGQGAIICLNVPTHNFPAPKGSFLWEELITNDVEAAKHFYSELLGWTPQDIDTNQGASYAVMKCADGAIATGITNQAFDAVESPIWIPYLATNDIDATLAKARAIGGKVRAEANMPNGDRKAILADPTGAIFGLLESGEFRT